ncbi:hypothetical protein CALCODRAFT_169184 [Calocera cornea HHB12733]|uniref:Uncharacterized protein n=1 Tax=Calocera cornea HHB12733 TaxID=1353952 RepID=A0A165CH03_9BASI|nr:hypothetical protein CALCODRAFT_169184 [Calocera cornea HHB12733]
MTHSARAVAALHLATAHASRKPTWEDGREWQTGANTAGSFRLCVSGNARPDERLIMRVKHEPSDRSAASTNFAAHDGKITEEEHAESNDAFLADQRGFGNCPNFAGGVLVGVRCRDSPGPWWGLPNAGQLPCWPAGVIGDDRLDTPLSRRILAHHCQIRKRQ